MRNWSACWLVCALVLVGCQSPQLVESPNARPIPLRQDRNGLKQLIKTDMDRLADLEYAENADSLRALMLKLYKRNPAEAPKSGLGTPERIAAYVFEQASSHQWQFPQLSNLQGTQAILLAFQPEYTGDRILALTVGIQSMLFVAHGHNSAFIFTDSLEPQSLYNAARNVEIAIWKLSTATCKVGTLCLLTNSMQGDAHNLSFEREFAKIIARTDLLAFTLAEKSQRFISRVTQVVGTRPFFPF